MKKQVFKLISKVKQNSFTKLHKKGLDLSKASKLQLADFWMETFM